MYSRILIPLDGSALAEAVLPHAGQIARRHGAELRLFRVVVFPALGTSIAKAAATQALQGEVEGLRAEARAYIEQMTATLRADGFAASGSTGEGEIGSAILCAAREQGCDLIAMSTHGRSGSARWLMGSIADRVVRQAPVPVLLIRPQWNLTMVKRRREAQTFAGEARWI